MKQEHVTWDHVRSLLSNIHWGLRWGKFRPDVIVGVARGGMVPATMLSYDLGVSLACVDVSLRDRASGGPPDWSHLQRQLAAGQRVLVVDDINDTGATIQAIQTALPPGDLIRTATLLDNQGSAARVDFCGRRVDKRVDPVWYVFPWEIPTLQPRI